MIFDFLKFSFPLGLSRNGEFLYVEGSTGLFIYERVDSGPFTSIQKVSDTSIHSNAQVSEDGKYLAFFYNESLLQTYEKVNGTYSLLQQIYGSSYSLLSMSPNSSYIPVSETVSTDLKIYKKSEKTFALFRTLSIAFFIWRLTITDTHLLATGLFSNILIYENRNGVYAQAY